VVTGSILKSQIAISNLIGEFVYQLLVFALYFGKLYGYSENVPNGLVIYPDYLSRTIYAVFGKREINFKVHFTVLLQAAVVQKKGPSGA